MADENYKRKLTAILTADRAGTLGAQVRENHHDIHPRPKPGWIGSQEPRVRFVEEKRWFLYTETIYYLSPRVVGCLIASNPKTYAGSGYGMLCRDFAAHRCYKETI